MFIFEFYVVTAGHHWPCVEDHLKVEAARNKSWSEFLQVLAVRVWFLRLETAQRFIHANSHPFGLRQAAPIRQARLHAISSYPYCRYWSGPNGLLEGNPEYTCLPPQAKVLFPRSNKLETAQRQPVPETLRRCLELQRRAGLLHREQSPPPNKLKKSPRQQYQPPLNPQKQQPPTPLPPARLIAKCRLCGE